jgi:MOSC domain-containing protein YiiM
MTGRLTHIYIASESASPMQALDEANLVSGNGIEGDRYFGADTGEEVGELTLIEAEQIAHFSDTTGVTISASDTRRNLVTGGIDLNALEGKQFNIGGVRAEGVELCEPCATLGRILATEQISAAQVVKTLTRRGGLRARILSDGTIKVNDTIG